MWTAHVHQGARQHTLKHTHGKEMGEMGGTGSRAQKTKIQFKFFSVQFTYLIITIQKEKNNFFQFLFALYCMFKPWMKNQ